MSHWTTTFPLEPVAKGRPRVTRTGHAYTPAKTRKAEGTLKLFLANANPMHFGSAPVCVALEFTFARPKSVSVKKRPHCSTGSDLDNLCKSVLDSANGILWDDDKQVVTLIAKKRYGERDAIKITVWHRDRGMRGIVRRAGA